MKTARSLQCPGSSRSPHEGGPQLLDWAERKRKKSSQKGFFFYTKTDGLAGKLQDVETAQGFGFPNQSVASR